MKMVKHYTLGNVNVHQDVGRVNIEIIIQKKRTSGLVIVANMILRIRISNTEMLLLQYMIS